MVHETRTSGDDLPYISCEDYDCTSDGKVCTNVNVYNDANGLFME